MNRQPKTLLTGILGAALLAFTAGCGNSSTASNPSSDQQASKSAPVTAPISPSVTPATPQTNASTGQNGTSSSSASAGSSGTSTPAQPDGFSTVIQDAMKPFASHPPVPLMAPTVLPQPQSGPTAISARTWKVSPHDYYVQLLQTATAVPVNQADPNHVKALATFSGKQVSSASVAADQVLGITGYMDPDNPKWRSGNGTTQKSTLDFGKGITARTYQYTADKPSAKFINKYAGIYWEEGRWQICVIDYNSTTLPLTVAKQVVKYLDTHFLPIPEEKAAVVVQVNSTANEQNPEINTAVTWQRGSILYQIDTSPYTSNSAITALQMAVSMSPFVGEQ